MQSTELVVSEFNSEIQKKILDKMNTEYLVTGKFVKDQISVSPKVWSSLMLSGSAAGTAVSSAMSTSLFIATANPATLMSLGSGVGSAVMSASGIAAQAPFIAAAGAMIPVIAPVMAMQALSSVVMLQQFHVMDKKLDAIKVTIDKILARQEVTKVAELFAAVNVVDEIYAQYGQTGCFSTDMLIRLALAERDVMQLTRRYEMLESFATSDTDTNGFDNYDTYCTVLASFLNLRVKYLRTCVDVQENPQFVQRSSESFATLLKDNIVLWDKLLNKSGKMKDEIKELEVKRENANPLQKMNVEKELKQKREKLSSTMEKERAIIEDFLLLIESAKQVSEATSTQVLPIVLYWHDNDGEHCIATNEKISDVVA